MRCRYFLVAAIVSISVFSCSSTSTETTAADIGVIAEEKAPVIVIVEDPVPSPVPETIAEEEEEIAAVPELSSADEPVSDEQDADPIAFSITSSDVREQSAILSITYPQDTDLSKLSIEGGGYISEIKATGKSAKIKIEGLESLSEYSLSLSYEGGVVTEPFKITTASFSGRYLWLPADGSEGELFAVDVTEAPSDSDYRYYIYLDSEDSAFPEGFSDNEIRIAPLIDKDESLDDVKYKDSPESYKWTNYKWNTGSMTPSKIKYVEAAMTETGDEINTSIASVALGFTAEADVRFVFHEDDGRAYLSFYNKMTPGIANNFLKKNPSPNIRPYEENEYWYTLERE